MLIDKGLCSRFANRVYRSGQDRRVQTRIGAEQISWDPQGNGRAYFCSSACSAEPRRESVISAGNTYVVGAYTLEAEWQNCHRTEQQRLRTRRWFVMSGIREWQEERNVDILCCCPLPEKRAGTGDSTCPYAPRSDYEIGTKRAKLTGSRTGEISSPGPHRNCLSTLHVTSSE